MTYKGIMGQAKVSSLKGYFVQLSDTEISSDFGA